MLNPLGIVIIVLGILLGLIGIYGSQHAIFPGLFPAPATSSTSSTSPSSGASDQTPQQVPGIVPGVPPGEYGPFSFPQLQGLARRVGFSQADSRIAAAVALAESQGNPNSYNPEREAGTPAGSGSRGLWQVYGYAHPEYNNASLFNPLTNARAAFQLWRDAGNSFFPWTTFRSGAYRRYLPAGG